MFDISDEKYEELRQILEKQNELAYAPEEAKKIGSRLVNFYSLLVRLNSEEHSNAD